MTPENTTSGTAIDKSNRRLSECTVRCGR
jgi:hypothetical protein